jgi:hypothetical protein
MSVNLDLAAAHLEPFRLALRLRSVAEVLQHLIEQRERKTPPSAKVKFKRRREAQYSPTPRAGRRHRLSVVYHPGHPPLPKGGGICGPFANLLVLTALTGSNRKVFNRKPST